MEQLIRIGMVFVWKHSIFQMRWHVHSSPSVVLKAGELYKEKTEYLFSVME